MKNQESFFELKYMYIERIERNHKSYVIILQEQDIVIKRKTVNELIYEQNKL